MTAGTPETVISDAPATVASQAFKYTGQSRKCQPGRRFGSPGAWLFIWPAWQCGTFREATTAKGLACPGDLTGIGMNRFLEALWLVLRVVVSWIASVVSSMIVLTVATVLSYTVMRIIFGHW